MNTIALCIPAYNAESYLPRLLLSAQKQLVPFDEIWVYNDCSTDATAAVAKQYGAKVINGDVNSGCSYGKNILAQNTNCQWIHFHDADDELLPNFTTLAHKWVVKPNCPDVVLFNYEYRDNETNQLLAIRNFDKDALLKDTIAYAIKEQINQFCGLYRKTAHTKAGGYDTDPFILYNEDKAYHIRLAINGLSFSAEPEISIINYRISNSMSAANVGKCLHDQYYVLKKTTVSHGQKYKAELAEEFWHCAVRLAAEKDWEFVRKALSEIKGLGFNHFIEKPFGFKALASANPFFALWVREMMIRIFKPYLRKR